MGVMVAGPGNLRGPRNRVSCKARNKAWKREGSKRGRIREQARGRCLLWKGARRTGISVRVRKGETKYDSKES